MKRAPTINNHNPICPDHPERPYTYAPPHLMIVQRPPGFGAQIANHPKKCKTPTQVNLKSAEALMQQSKAKTRFHSKSP